MIARRFDASVAEHMPTTRAEGLRLRSRGQRRRIGNSHRLSAVKGNAAKGIRSVARMGDRTDYPDSAIGGEERVEGPRRHIHSVPSSSRGAAALSGQ